MAINLSSSSLTNSFSINIYLPFFFLLFYYDSNVMFICIDFPRAWVKWIACVITYIFEWHDIWNKWLVHAVHTTLVHTDSRYYYFLTVKKSFCADGKRMRVTWLLKIRNIFLFVWWSTWVFGQIFVVLAHCSTRSAFSK